MATYRVEIGYRTKRGGVAVGMTVDAFGPDEAEEYAHRQILKGHPARKFAYCKISEATPHDIAMDAALAEETKK